MLLNHCMKYHHNGGGFGEREEGRAFDKQYRGAIIGIRVAQQWSYYKRYNRAHKTSPYTLTQCQSQSWIKQEDDANTQYR